MAQLTLGIDIFHIIQPFLKPSAYLPRKPTVFSSEPELTHFDGVAVSRADHLALFFLSRSLILCSGLSRCILSRSATFLFELYFLYHRHKLTSDRCLRELLLLLEGTTNCRSRFGVRLIFPALLVNSPLIRIILRPSPVPNLTKRTPRTTHFPVRFSEPVQVRMLSRRKAETIFGRFTLPHTV